MNQEEEIKKEMKNWEIARMKGWTDIHGRLADGGVFLRGFPPGSNGRGLQQPIPDYVATMTGGLLWHKLHSERDAGGKEIGCIGATCVDGIAIIACWKLTAAGWVVDVIDTEEGTWRPRLEIDGQMENIPDEPPLLWDDKD